MKITNKKQFVFCCLLASSFKMSANIQKNRYKSQIKTKKISDFYNLCFSYGFLLIKKA